MCAEWALGCGAGGRPGHPWLAFLCPRHRQTLQGSGSPGSHRQFWESASPGNPVSTRSTLTQRRLRGQLHPPGHWPESCVRRSVSARTCRGPASCSLNPSRCGPAQAHSCGRRGPFAWGLRPSLPGGRGAEVLGTHGGELLPGTEQSPHASPLLLSCPRTHPSQDARCHLHALAKRPPAPGGSRPWVAAGAGAAAHPPLLGPGTRGQRASARGPGRWET